MANGRRFGRLKIGNFTLHGELLKFCCVDVTVLRRYDVGLRFDAT